MKFKVQAPDGRTVMIEGDSTPTERELEEIFSSLPAPKQTENPDLTREGLDKAVGAATSFDNGVSFGFGRKLGGAINAAGAAPVDWLRGKNFLESVKDRYNEIVQNADNAQERFAKENPGTSLALEVAGGLTNPSNFAGVGYIGGAAGTLGKIGRAGLVGMAGGAANTLGQAKSFENVKNNVAEDVALGGGIGVALPMFGIAARAANKILGKAGSSVLGVTTGAGGESVGRAYNAGKRGSKEFLKNLRGRESSDKIVGQAMSALDDMKTGNSDLYRGAMNKMYQQTAGVKLNMEPINQTFRRTYNEATLGGNKNLLRGDKKRLFNEMEELLTTYNNTPSLQNTVGLNKLKQLTRDIKVTPGSDAERIKTQMANEINDIISRQNPKYKQINKIYSDNKNEIEQIKKAFSLDKRASVDTVMRKLQSTGRNNVNTNYGYRNDLLKNLDFGGDLQDAIAGQALNSWTPRGLTGTAAGLLELSNLNLSALASSPRLVGESAYLAGKVASKLPKVDTAQMTPYVAQLVNSLRNE